MSAEQCDTPAGHRECAPRRVEGALCGSYDGLQECWIQDFREEPAVTRDRDPAGRPRQARPRDALGRPLPYGAMGVEPVPEEPLPPMKSLQVARQLVKAGRPFAAHEVLEARWKTGPAEERDLWQGLAQLCVGLTHASRGNSVGALRWLSGVRADSDRTAPVGAPLTGWTSLRLLPAREAKRPKWTMARQDRRAADAR